MSPTRTSRRTRITAVACALALTVAACGGDDDAPTTTAEDEAPVATEPEPEAEPAPEPDPEPEAAPEPEPEPEPAPAPEPDPAPEPEPEAGPDRTLLDVAADAGDFTILLTAVEVAGLDEELSRRDRTLLAPTDEAFEALGPETVDALLDDVDTLRGILANHLLPLPQTAADIALFNNVLAIGGASWDIDAGEPFRIGPATVVEADIEADNGFIHALDTVLVEPAAEGG